jgi:hypothetical protein
VAWTDQAVPFHASASVTARPVPVWYPPTAAQARGDRQDTP